MVNCIIINVIVVINMNCLSFHLNTHKLLVYLISLGSFVKCFVIGVCKCDLDPTCVLVRAVVQIYSLFFFKLNV